ncbi:MAG: ABC transporter ATP-binding protein [bacterium]|nr:ABC transporter ATP-binding protein [bacterium]
MAISIQNLVKVYPKKNGNPPVRALDGFSCRVKKGEIYGLLGLNGSGKSTVIKICTTLLKPTGGEIKVLGLSPTTEGKELRPKIGLVAQSVSLNEYASVLENFLFFGKRYPKTKEFLEKEIRDLSDIFELHPFLNRMVKDLSGGMKRKVDVATSLLHRPELLFLDEPTLGLDVPFRRTMWKHLLQLVREREMTIMLTTHYLEEADQLCDTVGIIHHGKLLIEGKSNDLKKSIIQKTPSTTLDDVFLYYTGLSIQEETEQL